MANLNTKYLGLNLKNPIIAASSGLTNSVEEIKKMVDKGVGAVVLKSIFEEQIRHETEKLMNTTTDERMQPMQKGYADIMAKRSYDYAEALDYMSNFAKEHTLNEYLKFIETVKKTVNVPIIASVNCVFTYEWQYFAKKIQDAGADAIELNVYVLPSDPKKTGIENEQVYSHVIETVKKYVSIPVSLKIGYYFSGLSNKIIELSNTGIAGLVLFNRPYTPDIDINTFEITAANIYSSPEEYAHTLRWVGLLSGRLGCDIAAATGIRNHESVIKQLLAGANAVQMASAFYKLGYSIIPQILNGMEKWMSEHGFKTIEDFRGKLSQVKLENPANYERVQFMKLYANIS